VSVHRSSEPSLRGAVRRRLGPLLATAALLATATAGAAEEAPLPVVASFSILGDVVQQVGGDRIRLQVLVGPGSDAHVYQPTPAQARTVAAARVLVSNGLGFEGWLARFLRAAGFKGRHVVVTDGLPPLRSGDGAAPAGHRHDVDPHAWQDAAKVVHYAERVADGLCAADAAGCAGYRARAAAYAQRLRALDREIRDGWAQVPAAQRKVITSHDAFGHYAAAYGVRFLAPQGVSTNAEASARGVAALVRQIKAEGVRALFVETIADPRLIEQIARETGVRPAGALYSDSLSEAGGPAASYEALMRHNTQAMLAAVRQP
jgi:zinc/manganese transport system substrate-binding protein